MIVDSRQFFFWFYTWKYFVRKSFDLSRMFNEGRTVYFGLNGRWKSRCLNKLFVSISKGFRRRSGESPSDLRAVLWLLATCREKTFLCELKAKNYNRKYLCRMNHSAAECREKNTRARVAQFPVYFSPSVEKRLEIVRVWICKPSGQEFEFCVYVHDARACVRVQIRLALSRVEWKITRNYKILRKGSKF